MCPACAATVALLIGSAISTGGVTAFVAKKFGAKKFGAEKFAANGAGRNASAQLDEKENHDGQRQA